MFYPEREKEDKTTPLARFAFHIYRSFVSGHHSFDVTEPKAETFHIVQVAGMYSIKLIEDMLSGFLAHPDALIFNDNLYTVGYISRADTNFRILGRILIGVVQQVVYNIGNVGLIAFYDRIGCFQLGRCGPVLLFYL
mgnify:CR=1 FL=1